MGNKSAREETVQLVVLVPKTYHQALRKYATDRNTTVTAIFRGVIEKLCKLEPVQVRKPGGVSKEERSQTAGNTAALENLQLDDE